MARNPSSKRLAVLVRTYIDENLSPTAQSMALARFARTTRDEYIQAGWAEPEYRTFVDGRADANEDTVAPAPSGRIRYVFGGSLASAAMASLEFLKGRSPVGRSSEGTDGGLYRRSWIVVVDQRLWTGTMGDIPSGSEVFITNPLPYHRKIETGAIVTTVAPHLIGDAVLWLRKNFPKVLAQTTIVRLPSGLVSIPNRFGPVPYILKGRGVRSGLKYDKKRRSFIRVRPAQRTDERGRRRGEQMTYPALALSQR